MFKQTKHCQSILKPILAHFKFKRSTYKTNNLSILVFLFTVSFHLLCFSLDVLHGEGVVIADYSSSFKWTYFH